MSSERGLVISIPTRISGNSITWKETHLDPQELRFSLLFWDRLDFPKCNPISFESDETCQFLERSGILQRTVVRDVGKGEVTQQAVTGYLNAFKMLDEKEPGIWSLGVGKNSVSFTERDLEAGRGVLVRLYQAIPVPDRDVPLQDILEFRDNRRSELLALRHHLERIYQRVVDAGDGELALKTEVESLDQAIADYIRVSQESGLKFRGMSFEANLNLLSAGLAAQIAWDRHLGISGALLAGVAAGLAIGPSVSLVRHKVTQTPFRYISSFHEKLF